MGGARIAPAAVEATPDAMEGCFLRLLDMDRESDAFLACFWELDRMLEAAMAAEGRGVRAGTGERVGETVRQQPKMAGGARAIHRTGE